MALSKVGLTKDQKVTGNVSFQDSGARITGDFSNATITNRVMFQTSTVNGATSIAIIPNGSSTISQLQARNNSDPTNCAIANFRANDTEVSVQSNAIGTGTYLPLTFYTGGSERMRIDTSGNFQYNNGYGSVATVYGCRAWVNFNGTGAIAIRGSGNVTSITDNGTGSYTVNFTTAMPDVNYGVVGSSDPDNAQPWVFSASTLGTTSCRVFTSRPAIAYVDGNVYAAFTR